MGVSWSWDNVANPAMSLYEHNNGENTQRPGCGRLRRRARRRKLAFVGDVQVGGFGDLTESAGDADARGIAKSVNVRAGIEDRFWSWFFVATSASAIVDRTKRTMPSTPIPHFRIRKMVQPRGAGNLCARRLSRISIRFSL